MTIAAAFLTSEGVVLGADSTTTIGTQGGVTQLLNHAQKIFEVGENSKMGIGTWGAGRIGQVSHRTLIARLSDSINPQTTTVRQAADKFIEIVSREYGDGSTTGIAGYVIGGWDQKTHLPACFHFVFQPGIPPDISPFNMGEARFFGCPEFFTRVFHGYDSRLPGILLAELQKVVPLIRDADFMRAFQSAVAPLAAVGFGDLPIREAIDYVHMYLHVTIKAFKFRFGPPVCGGPIEIAFISSDRPFRWVCHKSFKRAIYEQEGRYPEEV